MPLSDFLPKRKIAGFLEKVRVGGETIASVLRQNRRNSKKALKDMFRRAVLAEHDIGRFMRDLEAAIKRRRTHTRTTLRDVMTGIRGQARAVLASGQRGRWWNRSIIDSRTSTICLGYVGRSWDQSYNQIEDKPPRHQHCRSFLEFVRTGDPEPDDRDFMEIWRDSPELQQDLLGPTKFEALQSGSLGSIRGTGDVLRILSSTLEELGI